MGTDFQGQEAAQRWPHATKRGRAQGRQASRAELAIPQQSSLDVQIQRPDFLTQEFARAVPTDSQHLFPDSRHSAILPEIRKCLPSTVCAAVAGRLGYYSAEGRVRRL